MLHEEGASSGGPSWICTLEHVIRTLRPKGQHLDVAVVTTVRPSCRHAYVAALGMAAAEALRKLTRSEERQTVRLRQVSDIATRCTGRPFGLAHLIAGVAAYGDAFTLLDAGTMERLPLEAPGPDELGWGLMEPDTRGSVWGRSATSTLAP